MLGIITVLKEWRAFLYSTIEPFRVITDYKNLVRFLTIKELVLRIYKLSLLIKVKIDILDFILRVYLTQQYPDR